MSPLHSRAIELRSTLQVDRGVIRNTWTNEAIQILFSSKRALSVVYTYNTIMVCSTSSIIIDHRMLV